MDDIYVIICGDMCELSNVGYATSEDEAIQICAKHNKTVKRADECWEYQAVSHIQDCGDEENIVYVYSAYFHRKKRKRKYTLEWCELSDYYIYNGETENNVDIDIDEFHGIIKVEVKIKERNVDTAKHIIKNELLKYINKNNFKIAI